MTDYATFLESKQIIDRPTGIAKPPELSSSLFDFQSVITTWALKRGRAAIFADCGLGKTLMQLEWARVVSEHTDKPVLILAPLAEPAQLSLFAEASS